VRWVAQGLIARKFTRPRRGGPEGAEKSGKDGAVDNSPPSSFSATAVRLYNGPMFQKNACIPGKGDNMTSTLETVERAIAQLSSEELAQFRKWFAEYDGDIWDAQIEADAKAGKLDALAQEALMEYQAGKVTEI